MSVIIRFNTFQYHRIREYLLQDHLERVSFLFSKSTFSGQTLVIEVCDYYLVVPDEYEYQSDFHVELKDSCQAKVIRNACEKKLSLGEIHSHPASQKAAFSQSDISGFREFVPHVWWRLQKGPYFAILLALSELDALVWVRSSEFCEPVERIEVDSFSIRPSNSTKLLKEQKWRRKFSLDIFPFLGRKDKKK